MNIIQVLNEVQQAYTRLSDECIEDLVSVMSLKTFKKNEIIVKQGQYAKMTYLILEGAMRVYYLKDDKDVSDWFAFENEFATSIVSYFSDKPSAHYIQAMEDTTVAEISKENIDRLCKKHPDLETFVKSIVVDTMLKQQKRISSILFYSADEKYSQMQKEFQECLARIPLTHVASFLGMTLETLSRVRARK
jgi:CRP-like cAMP-binding protein